MAYLWAGGKFMGVRGPVASQLQAGRGRLEALRHNRAVSTHNIKATSAQMSSDAQSGNWSGFGQQRQQLTQEANHRRWFNNQAHDQRSANQGYKAQIRSNLGF